MMKRKISRNEQSVIQLSLTDEVLKEVVEEIAKVFITELDRPVQPRIEGLADFLPSDSG